MEFENKKITEKKINGIKTWFFKKVSKIDKTLAKLKILKGGEETNCQDQKWNNKYYFRPYRHHKTKSEYYNPFYTRKFDDLDEMDQFPKKQTTTTYLLLNISFK